MKNVGPMNGFPAFSTLFAQVLAGDEASRVLVLPASRE
jgi:hypothetical protein